MANRRPRVAVIVRTKDRSLLLSRALDDILNQTMEDWELVVVNDGGSARPVDELVSAREERLAKRCRVVHNPSSRGMEAAANQGIEATSAEFLVIHDDDDTWDKTFLAQTLHHLERDSGAVAVLAGTEIVLERIDGDQIVEMGRQPFGPPGSVVTLFDLLLVNRFVPIGLLMRRAVVNELGGFDETLPVVGDWEFHLRLASYGRVAFLEGPPLAFWRQRPQQSGPLSNSVHEASGMHFRYDRLVRERALIEYAKTHGVGGLLYLSKLVNESETRIAAGVADAERRMTQMIAEGEDRIMRGLGEAELRMMNRVDSTVHEHVRYHSVQATLRRLLRRGLPRRK